MITTFLKIYIRTLMGINGLHVCPASPVINIWDLNGWIKQKRKIVPHYYFTCVFLTTLVPCEELGSSNGSQSLPFCDRRHLIWDRHPKECSRVELNLYYHLAITVFWRSKIMVINLLLYRLIDRELLFYYNIVMNMPFLISNPSLFPHIWLY